MNTKSEFDQTITLLQKAAADYYNGKESDLTDDQYDEGIANIAAAVEANPEWLTPEVDALLNAVAAGTAKAGNIQHGVPMLSLLKSTDLDDVEKFAASLSSSVVVEPKIDGIAAVARYVDGKLTTVATRGDGNSGEDITEKVARLNITGLPQELRRPVNVEVRGEIYMSPKDFEFSNAARLEATGEAFSNPRNAVSGTVMRETVRHEAKASFAVYEVIAENGSLGSDSYSDRVVAVKSLGFSLTPSAIHLGLEDAIAGVSISEAIQWIGKHRALGELQAPIDGVVIKANSTMERNRLGAGSRHPRWAMAYKFEASKTTTVLRDIKRAVGRTGNISYTAVLDSVHVDGSNVDRATLHNSAFIAEKDIRIGDTVALYKAGDIIPRVDEAIIAKRPEGTLPYVAPTTCPDCTEELERSGAIWRCETPTCSVAAGIAYAVSRDCLDVDGFSTAIADALVESEMVSRLSDIFYLNADELAALPMGVTKTGSTRVLGSTVAKKIVAGLEAAKSQPLHRVVCALGIKMTGRGMSRRLAAAFGSMDALVNATEEDFLNKGIDAVGPVRATAFVRGFALMRKDIERMTAAGVNMHGDTQDDDTTGGAEKPLAGMKVVVTGTVPGLSRTEAAEAVERLGGTSSGSVSKSTNLVVVGEGAGSKAQKAEDLGVRIMPAEEFAALAAGGAA